MSPSPHSDEPSLKAEDAVKGPQQGVLMLLPNLLGDVRHHEVFLPASVDRAVANMDGLIAESEQQGLRFLKRFQTKKPPNETPLSLFNEHTPDNEIDFLLEPLYRGERWGFVSDAGLPCIADPGSLLVHRARQLGIAVQSFVGPSSFLMSLMLSGLPGQRFYFQGYLDKEPQKRKVQIQKLEKTSQQDNATQIFMEAPYRNKHMLESLMEMLSDETHLAVVWDVTLPTQGIVSQPIRLWKKSPLPNIEKKPAVFLLYSGSI